MTVSTLVNRFGLMVRVFHELTEGWFNEAVAASVVSALIVTVMELPAWVPFALRAVNAAPKVA